MINDLSTQINICLKKPGTIGIQEKPTTTTKPVHMGLVLQLLLLQGACGSHHLAQTSSRPSVGEQLKA